MVCDFNAGIYPKTAITYDYIVCSGLLEYIRNPDTFLKRISTLGQNIILSYAVTLPLQQKRWRLSMGWFNNYSQKELEDLFLSLGFNFIICGEWEQQIIYHLWIKKSITPTSVLSLKI